MVQYLGKDLYGVYGRTAVPGCCTMCCTNCVIVIENCGTYILHIFLGCDWPRGHCLFTITY